MGLGDKGDELAKTIRLESAKAQKILRQARSPWFNTIEGVSARNYMHQKIEVSPVGRPEGYLTRRQGPPSGLVRLHQNFTST